MLAKASGACFGRTQGETLHTTLYAPQGTPDQMWLSACARKSRPNGKREGRVQVVFAKSMADEENGRVRIHLKEVIEQPQIINFADVDYFIGFLLTEPEAPVQSAGAENNRQGETNDVPQKNLFPLNR
jgi:hypothetical protein